MQPKPYQEFPRVVYGPGGQTKVINSEDERPDGYCNTPAAVEDEYTDDHAKAEEAARATAARDTAKGELDALGVKYAANAHTDTLVKRVAEAKAEMKEMTDMLNEHEVVIPPGADHASLTVLCEKLEAHLASQPKGKGGE